MVSVLRVKYIRNNYIQKVLAGYESGVTSPARLEDTIGALALDGRYSPLLKSALGNLAPYTSARNSYRRRFGLQQEGSSRREDNALRDPEMDLGFPR